MQRTPTKQHVLDYMHHGIEMASGLGGASTPEEVERVAEDEQSFVVAILGFRISMVRQDVIMRAFFEAADGTERAA